MVNLNIIGLKCQSWGLVPSPLHNYVWSCSLYFSFFAQIKKKPDFGRRGKLRLNAEKFCPAF